MNELLEWKLNAVGINHLSIMLPPQTTHTAPSGMTHTCTHTSVEKYYNNYKYNNPVLRTPLP